MLFHLLSEHINIFRYLTFRSMFAGVTAFLLVFFLGPQMITMLRQMKLGQQVRDDGPEAHIKKTGTPTMGGLLIWLAILCSSLLWSTLNAFIGIILLTVVLYASIGFIDDYAKIKQKDTKGLSARGKLILQVIFATLVLFLTSLMPQYHKSANQLSLRIVDDNRTVVATTNVNILNNWEWQLPEINTPKTHYFVIQYDNPDTGKITVQTNFTIPAVLSSKSILNKISSKQLSNNQYQVFTQIMRSEKVSTSDSPDREESVYAEWTYRARLFRAFFVPMYTDVVWYWPLILAYLFYIFIIVGVSNATNLTDGLDGLATGMGMSFYLPFGIFAYLIGHIGLSSYLIYPYIEGAGELAVFIAAAVGAFSGFLWYNVHPAAVFMGDTGSLPMGAAIAMVAIMLKQEILLMVAGFMFMLETVSVILQVFWFKNFKKRIFRMAPIHHHFELSGWKENQVVVRFWIMSAFCAILALATIKIR